MINRSLTLNLENIIKNLDFEQKVLENIRRCSKLNKESFQIIFWHNNLSKKVCKDFVKRNEHLLFEVNTKITKGDYYAWFLISDGIPKETVSYRYRWDGDILQGLVKYMEIAKFCNRGVR